MKTIDLDKILGSNAKVRSVIEDNFYLISSDDAIKCMTEAIRQALDIAAEQAKVEKGINPGAWTASVDKNSITNVINQVK